MVKWNRLLLITASMGLLAACGNGDDSATEDETVDETGEVVEESNEETEEGSDVTTGATQSRVSDEESLLEGISDEGAWIVIFEDNVSSDEELVLTGGFENNDGESERKLALYEQDADRNVTGTFTLSAPSLTIEQENTRLQYGTFEGDVYVEAEGFRLLGGTIDGDLIFASEELQDSAEIDEDATITGETRVDGEASDNGETADATTGATQSVVNDEDSLLEGLSNEGGWIVIFQDDVSSDEELVMVDGFENNNGEVERKLALYEQDADRNVTGTFTLSAPSITIQNENTRLQYGTFEGDVYVEANGFKLLGGTIDGDLIFASEEFEESAEIDDDATITGETRVD
ncbi:MAG: hypothetical protein JJU16_04275 [Alkalibacterium sp.]|nr:hypothetical protein [Alkalibacterium sp.]